MKLDILVCASIALFRVGFTKKKNNFKMKFHLLVFVLTFFVSYVTSWVVFPLANQPAQTQTYSTTPAFSVPKITPTTTRSPVYQTSNPELGIAPTRVVSTPVLSTKDVNEPARDLLPPKVLIYYFFVSVVQPLSL